MERWIQTWSGKDIDPLDIDLEKIGIGDIANSLAMTCRFRGHCKNFYSVAEHSVRVSVLLQREYPDEPKLLMLGLMHDAAEAYLFDAPSPIKPDIAIANRPMKEVEAEILNKIYRALDMVWALKQTARTRSRVEAADDIMLATEKRDVMNSCKRKWQPLPPPDHVTFYPWPWDQARSAFLQRYHGLWQVINTPGAKVSPWDERYSRQTYLNVMGDPNEDI